MNSWALCRRARLGAAAELKRCQQSASPAWPDGRGQILKRRSGKCLSGGVIGSNDAAEGPCSSRRTARAKHEVDELPQRQRRRAQGDKPGEGVVAKCKGE